MYDVFIGLGANLGDRFASLQHALSEIEKIAEVVQTSSIYETEPIGMNSVHQFLNMALKIRTDFEPQLLLHKLKYIEKKGAYSHFVAACCSSASAGLASAAPLPLPYFAS